MNTWKNWAAACLLAVTCGGAWAQTFTGQLAYHNDVAFHEFTVAAPGGVWVWTDSFQNGLNFDPIVSVWYDGVLVDYDDDGVAMPGQTRLDSFLALNLAPGNYVLGVSRYDNFPRDGGLSDGFIRDGSWHGFDGGHDYRVNVTFANALPVPEPATYATLLCGLGLLAAARRRIR